MKKPKKKLAARALSSASRATQQAALLPSRNRKSSRPLDEESVWLIAVQYCLFHYPTLYTGGKPRRCSSPATRDWIVPIVLGSPSRGVLGEVGELRIDGQSGKVVASTDRSQVVSRGAELYQQETKML